MEVNIIALTDGLVVIAVLCGFGYLIYSRLVKTNHPILQRGKEYFQRKKDIDEELKEDEKWNAPTIEKRIY